MARSNQTSIILALSFAVLVLAVAAGIYPVKSLFWGNQYDKYSKDEFVNQDTYQAVFLTNDQIYFGHLKNINDDYLILSDVYYVRVTEEQNALIKLGSIEPHGPEGTMTINKDQVLFWENLRPDSQVIRTIESMR